MLILDAVPAVSVNRPRVKDSSSSVRPDIATSAAIEYALEASGHWPWCNQAFDQEVGEKTFVD